MLILISATSTLIKVKDIINKMTGIKGKTIAITKNTLTIPYRNERNFTDLHGSLM